MNEAMKILRKTLAKNPYDPVAVPKMANLLQQQGRREEAIELLHRAAAANPTNTHLLNNLGIALLAHGRHDDAAGVFRQMLTLGSNEVIAHYNLGKVFGEIGQYEKAIAEYRRCIQLDPQYSSAYVNLGNTMMLMAQHQEAANLYTAALKIRPEDAETLCNLGAALRTLWKIDESIATYRRALQLRPDYHIALANLGNTLKDAGEIVQTIDLYRKALSGKPNDVATHSNLLFSLEFDPRAQPNDILREALRFEALQVKPLRLEIAPHTNDRDPSRRLRIGYISPDFRAHCQALFTIPFLSNHDHSQFEVTCFSTVLRNDDTTARIKSMVDHWVDVRGLSDEVIAAKIRECGIDILIDLTMHMSYARPLVMARKPAPVQVAYLAYPGTTGLSAIDYRLTDPYLDPPGQNDQDYSEKTVRLPDTFWCYDPIDEVDEPNELPAEAQGFVTFGCLNNFCKFNEGVLKLWSRALKQAGDFQLSLLAPPGSHRQRTLDAFKAEGLEQARIQFVDFQPRRKYLREYRNIDIGMDTLPANGHTTSLDAYWMGVPVVTRVGSTVAGRAGWSQLNNLGLTELAAQNDDEFVRIVGELARDLPRLAELRRTLRQRLKTSVLMDGPRFTRNLESAYRTMWQSWCAKA